MVNHSSLPSGRFFCGKNMSKVETIGQREILGKEKSSFPSSEMEVLTAYGRYFKKGAFFLKGRPFFNNTARVYLALQGLNPSLPSVLKELGWVWCYYDQSLFPADVSVDSIAGKLGIQFARVNHGLITAARKFEIYTQALLL